MMNKEKEWICPECNEMSESQFDACWKCGYSNSKNENIKNENEASLEFRELSYKYDSLHTFKLLIWLIHGIGAVALSICLFLIISPHDLFSNLAVLIISIIIFYIFYYISNAIGQIINFLFDLDKKGD